MQVDPLGHATLNSGDLPGFPTAGPRECGRPGHLRLVVLTRRLPRPAAFWSVAVILVLMLAASGVPSPLYRVYQEEMGFGYGMLTTCSASTPSRCWPRCSSSAGCPITSAAARSSSSLPFEAAAMVLFLAADGVGWLLAARVVQGLATGALTSTLGAALLDLQRPERPLAAFLNSASPGLGLSLGAVGAGCWSSSLPSPTEWVFGVLAVIFLLAAVGTGLLPEKLPAPARRGRVVAPGRGAARCSARFLVALLVLVAGLGAGRALRRSGRRWWRTSSASRTTWSAGC